jgi:hypothetical protein
MTPGLMFFVWTIGGSLSGAIAGLLLVRATGRRRVGAEVFCAGCGYDLRGIEVDAGEPRCPECGSAVGEKTGRVVGRRRRHVTLTMAGVLLLMLGIGAAGGLAWRAYHEIKWYELRPTAWVMADAQASRFAVARRAYAELLRRLAANALSEEQVQALADLAMTYRASAFDPKHPWYRCDQMLDELLFEERLDAQRSKRYGETLVAPDLAVRELVVAGDPVPVRLNFSRYSKDMRVLSQIMVRAGAVLVDGEPVAPSDAVPLPGKIGWDFDVLMLLPAVEAGRHTVTFRAMAKSYQPLIVFPEALETVREFVVVADRAEAPVVRREVDEATEEFVRDLLQPEGYRAMRVLPMTADQARECFVPQDYDAVHFDGVPMGFEAYLFLPKFESTVVDLAYDVYVVLEPEPILTMRFAIPAGQGPNRFPRSFVFPALKGLVPRGLPPEVTFRLVPSEAAARRSVYVTEYADVTVELGPFDVDDYRSLKFMESLPGSGGAGADR